MTIYIEDDVDIKRVFLGTFVTYIKSMKGGENKMDKNEFFYEVERYLKDNGIECVFKEGKSYIAVALHSFTRV